LEAQQRLPSDFARAFERLEFRESLRRAREKLGLPSLKAPKAFSLPFGGGKTV